MAADPKALASRVSAALHKLESTWATTLSADGLEKLGILVGSPLDLETGDASPQPRYFEPMPPVSEELRAAVFAADDEIAALSLSREAVKSSWPSLCAEKHNTLSCPDRLLRFFSSMNCYPVHDFRSPDTAPWLTMEPSKKTVKLPEYIGYFRHPEVFRSRPFEECPMWAVEFVYATTVGPHMGCEVLDSTVPEDDQFLRSEILAGLWFIKRQLMSIRNQTIPVLVLSVSHRETARLTQVVYDWDRQAIIVNKSRLLDMTTKTFDTPDVWSLVRWKALAPVPIASGPQTTRKADVRVLPTAVDSRASGREAGRRAAKTEEPRHSSESSSLGRPKEEKKRSRW